MVIQKKKWKLDMCYSDWMINDLVWNQNSYGYMILVRTTFFVFKYFELYFEIKSLKKKKNSILNSDIIEINTANLYTLKTGFEQQTFIILTRTRNNSL